MDNLSTLEQWASALLQQLSPADRRAAMRDIARELRRSQQARIAAQKAPDGTTYEPRKIRSYGKRLRGKIGRIARTAMFNKLRNSRWMSIEASGKELVVGFTGRVARIARVHQFGEKSPMVLGGREYRYPARVLLGLTAADRDMIRDRLLK